MCSISYTNYFLMFLPFALKQTISYHWSFILKCSLDVECLSVPPGLCSLVPLCLSTFICLNANTSKFFTFILFFKVLKDDKTTFRKSWVSNMRRFLKDSLPCITEQNRKQEEANSSCVKLLIYSSQIVFSFLWNCWKIHKLYFNDMNICFPSIHQNFHLRVHILYS